MHLKENIKLIKGFKLTDGNLYCRDYNFGAYSEIIGKTFKLDCKEEDLKMCEFGFHACDCIGKVDLFYPIGDPNRFFEIFVKKAFYEDAEKYVFTEFKVVGEITIPNGNTGDSNTGNSNTGDRNTGDGNTGDSNTGYRNTGYRNTGDRNTGYRNTGDRNTGDGNTGDGNTGNRNTGNSNTGYRNTGDRNTGDGNTGDRNLTNYSAGFFAIKEPKASCFGKPTKFTVQQFREKFIDIIKAEPAVENLMLLPNATKSKVEEYIKKYNQIKNKQQ
ncbi:MAG: hypothetical protein LBC68_08245 [Prevotellaceae bacterium]|jgi:hypothetical protein|nr:hypothetical protein [Prevotellaceae bacterium]